MLVHKQIVLVHKRIVLDLERNVLIPEQNDLVPEGNGVIPGKNRLICTKNDAYDGPCHQSGHRTENGAEVGKEIRSQKIAITSFSGRRPKSERLPDNPPDERGNSPILPWTTPAELEAQLRGLGLVRGETR